MIMGVVRSSKVNALQANIGQVVSLVLEEMFCSSFGNPMNGLLLKHPSGDAARNIRLYFDFGMVLQDGAAMKFTLNIKGDSSSKYCMLCKNARDGEVAQHLKLRDLQLASDTELLQSFQRCQQKKLELTGEDFALWQQAVGISHNDHALLLNQKLLSIGLLKPASQYCHDWMHMMCSQGIMQVLFYLTRYHLDCWDMMPRFLDLWSLPAATQKAGQLKQLFSAKKIKSYKQEKKIKCSASESLALCPLLAYLVSSAFASIGEYHLHSRAFLLMTAVLEMLQATPSGMVSPDALLQAVESALQACVDAG